MLRRLPGFRHCFVGSPVHGGYYLWWESPELVCLAIASTRGRLPCANVSGLHTLPDLANAGRVYFPSVCRRASCLPTCTSDPFTYYKRPRWPQEHIFVSVTLGQSSMWVPAVHYVPLRISRCSSIWYYHQSSKATLSLQISRFNSIYPFVRRI